MGYKALTHFEDLLDGRHPYDVGDVYPRQGYTPSEERVIELLGANNKMKKPVIALVSETMKEAEAVKDSPVEVVTDEPIKSKRGRKRKSE